VAGIARWLWHGMNQIGHRNVSSAYVSFA